MRALLFSALQYLLPKHLLTAAVYRLARVRHAATKNWLIRRFVALFDVNVDELKRSAPGDFRDFNDFFTRELADDARPVDTDSALVAPADGRVSQCGHVSAGRLIQAKGIDYSLTELLAVDVDDAAMYDSFATIYLAPFNYHRVHMPADGRLVSAHYVPGALFSVNRYTTPHVRNLFCRNERLNLRFETAAGPLLLSLVGAVNVGSITTPWTGEIRPRSDGPVEALSLARHGRDVARGDLLGWFNMGSTVIVVGHQLDWHCTAGQAVRMGQALAGAGGK